MAQEPGIFTAQQLAYRHIRERILDGRFAGGALLKPQAIAEHLAISRIPVREAMQQLAAEGLIQLRLNRTAVVTILTIPEINDLFEMRAALEALTAEGIARHVDAAAPDELEGLRARMDAARGDALQWLGRHGAFHDCLLGLCGRPRLAAEVVRLRTAIQPHLLFHIDIYRTTEMAGYEHETILAALRTGNAKVIEICLRDHVLSAARGVVQFLATHHPGLGETTGRAGEAAPARAVRGAAEARDAGSAAS